MLLSSLPLDVLLVVFQYLNIVDVIHVGGVSPFPSLPLLNPATRSRPTFETLQTCKDLYQATQSRHIWVDRLETLLREDPMLRPATPPLASLSAQELKSFVIGQIKLRLRWDTNQDDLGFAARGLARIVDVRNLCLLPGGKTLLAFDNRGSITLRRIKLVDGQVALPVVASFESDRGIIVFRHEQSKLLTTTSPCPILVHNK